MHTQCIVAPKSRPEDAHEYLDSLLDARTYVEAVKKCGYIAIEGPPVDRLAIFAVVSRDDGEEVLDADLASVIDAEPTAAE